MWISRREWLALTAAAGVGRRQRTAPALDRLATYPEIRQALRGRADDRARTLTSAGLDCRPADGALARSLDRPDVVRPTDAAALVPADGQLTFAVDLSRTGWVHGTLDLEPDADLRPGLRATVLCDDTIVGAPMVAAAPWGIREITDPAPSVHGTLPPTRLELAPWRLRAGRHYVTIAGPHVRAAGQVRRLRLALSDRSLETPLYSFAFISDTHVRREGREDWMNRKMGEASAPAFLATLRTLAAEGVSFVMHGGDLTEKATRDEFVLMRETLAAQPLTVYGSIGNHDRYLPSSRGDALEVLAAQFPSGTLDYVFSRPPLRFVVFDVAVEQDPVREAKIGWLRDTLAADRSTPTVFVWHYPPYNRGGVAGSGFQLQDWSELGRASILQVLRQAPNLVACLNGHDHWDEVNLLDGLPFVQNAAFVEWPNTYRLYHVYADRLEWEVRQVANRGFVRESCLPEKAVTWMIATREADLSGVVPFRRG